MNGLVNCLNCTMDGTCRRRRNIPRSVLAWAGFALLAAGCAQQAPRPDEPVKPPPPAARSAPPPINLSGYSAAFKEGFQAGCDTARGSARRDETRMHSDAQYAQGWEDARAICAKR